MQLDDLNFWRSLVTVVSLILFLCLVAWTWSRRRVSGFDEAAQVPFVDDDFSTAREPSEHK